MFFADLVQVYVKYVIIKVFLIPWLSSGLKKQTYSWLDGLKQNPISVVFGSDITIACPMCPISIFGKFSQKVTIKYKLSSWVSISVLPFPKIEIGYMGQAT